MLDIKEDLLDEDAPIVLPAEPEQGIQPKNRDCDLYVEVELPVAEDLFESEPEPEIRGYNMPYEARVAAEKEAGYLGFTKGTVVVPRAANAFQRVNPINWGIVLDTQVWEYHYQDHMYAPCKVQWVSNGATTYCWTDELIMTHPAPDSADLEMIKSGEY